MLGPGWGSPAGTAEWPLSLGSSWYTEAVSVKDLTPSRLV